MSHERHISASDLELYVVGAHDQISAPAIEAHLARCTRCAEDAAREARLELQLQDVARGARFCPGCDRVVSGERCRHCGVALEPGGYVVERVLVQTAHGRLYLARDASGEQVALKELVFTQVPTMATVEAFEKEGRVLQGLDHPRIPRFVASFKEGDGVDTRLYLAQEYVEGESLLARYAERRVTEAEVIDIARQVLEVLVYLQRLSPQIFHRDVKPANLVQRPDGDIVLVDFGSARDLGATTGATLAGTFGYMPMEQMVGIVDATSDLYALGASLCHLASRTPPWKVFEAGITRSKMNLSPELMRFLAKLTAQKASDRPRSAEEALELLDEVVKGEPRRLRPSVALAAALLVAAGAASWAFLRPSPMPVVVVDPVPKPAELPRPIEPPHPVLPAEVEPTNVHGEEPEVPSEAVEKIEEVPPAKHTPTRKQRVIAPDKLTRARELHDKAWRSWNAGDAGRAIELLNECLAVADLPKCHRTAGTVYAQLGDTKKALEHYKRYLQLDPAASDVPRVQEIVREVESQP